MSMETDTSNEFLVIDQKSNDVSGGKQIYKAANNVVLLTTKTLLILVYFTFYLDT